MILQHFKYSIIATSISIFVSAVFLYATKTHLYDLKQSLAENNLERYRLQRDVDHLNTLHLNSNQTAIPKPQRSHDERIVWIDGLQKAKTEQKLKYLQYQMSKLHNLPIDELSNNNYKLKAGNIALSLQLNDLPQLFAFFESLKHHIDTFDLKSCQLGNILIEKGKIKRDGRYLSANCSLAVFFPKVENRD